MRGLRTVPHLWKICEDMLELCPNAIMLQYVNPMAINTWAIAKKYPEIKQVGLCHSVQHTVNELASDLKIPVNKIRYLSAGINHIAYFLKFEEILDNGSFKDLYPVLKKGYEDGIFPRPESMTHARCPNKVRYEMMNRIGYFATESSEHFAEYVPWFIKSGREDLIEKFGIPLDEYPKRCVEQVEEWQNQLEEFTSKDKIDVPNSVEYASQIINSVWTGDPSTIYGNVSNKRFIPDLPDTRKEMADYCTSVRRLDDMMGTILDELKKSGQYDNTIVIFMSDHGMSLPFAKVNCYVQSTKTPLIIRWPKVIKSGMTDNEHLVSTVDLMPTILEAVEVKTSASFDGRSFLPLLLGKTQTGWDAVYTQFNHIHGRTPYPMRSIITRDYSYIFNPWSNGKRSYRAAVSYTHLTLPTKA